MLIVVRLVVDARTIRLEQAPPNGLGFDGPAAIIEQGLDRVPLRRLSFHLDRARQTIAIDDGLMPDIVTALVDVVLRLGRHLLQQGQRLVRVLLRGTEIVNLSLGFERLVQANAVDLHARTAASAQSPRIVHSQVCLAREETASEPLRVGQPFLDVLDQCDLAFVDIDELSDVAALALSLEHNFFILLLQSLVKFLLQHVPLLDLLAAFEQLLVHRCEPAELVLHFNPCLPQSSLSVFLTVIELLRHVLEPAVHFLDCRLVFLKDLYSFTVFGLDLIVQVRILLRQLRPELLVLRLEGVDSRFISVRVGSLHIVIDGSGVRLRGLRGQSCMQKLRASLVIILLAIGLLQNGAVLLLGVFEDLASRSHLGLFLTLSGQVLAAQWHHT